MVRTRFAPSPTGFLHVGGAYSALLDYAWAKKNKGEFIVRVEDTDVKRYVRGAEETIYEGLEWLGIKPDESPKVGGPYGPYRQSERLKIYQKYARELVEKGDAYYCFCPPERLERIRSECQRKKTPSKYDRLCRTANGEEAERRAKNGEKFVIRMKIPDNEKIAVSDLIRGQVIFDSNFLDDQILLKSDGFPTYHLAVVVDDHLMKITDVVRGEEWLPSAPKHILLYRYFGWQPPSFFHTPTLRNPDRTKLSKRAGHTALSWYKEQGYLPEVLINFLCLLGWSHPQGKEVFSLEEFIKLFDLKDFSPVGPIFNLEKLDWLNGFYIRQKSDKELVQYIKQFIPIDKTAENISLIDKTIPLVKERIIRFSDYWPLAGFFFEEPKLSADLFADPQSKNYLAASLTALTALKKWSKEDIEKTLQDLIKREGWKTGDFFMSFRLAITGSRITPPITDSAAILGKEKTLGRLRTALEVLK